MDPIGRPTDRRTDLLVSTYVMLARAVFFLPPPRVVANSLPKAGSHLVNAILSRLPRMMFSGVHRSLDDFNVRSAPTLVAGDPFEVDAPLLDTTLRKVRHGQFMTTHFPADREALVALDRHGFRKIFTLRDPRDIAVSDAFYISNSPRHFMYRRFSEGLRTVEQKITAIIDGFPYDEQYGRGQESLDARVRRFVGWMDAPGVLTCRFEELTSEHMDVRTGAVSAVAAHVERPLTAEQAARVAERAVGSKTATLRKGRSGEWRRHLTDDHKDALKDRMGDLLIDLGYETSRDW